MTAYFPVFVSALNPREERIMKRGPVIAVLAGLMVLVAATALTQHASAKLRKDKTPKHLITMAAEELQWKDAPNAPGVKVAVVSGDMAKGAYQAFAKFPAGQTHPMHTHTGTIKGVVISGTFLITGEDGMEKRLGPGSYFDVPGGFKHTSGSDASSECVIFQSQSEKFDMIPVGEKAAAH